MVWLIDWLNDWLIDLELLRSVFFQAIGKHLWARWDNMADVIHTLRIIFCAGCCDELFIPESAGGQMPLGRHRNVCHKLRFCVSLELYFFACTTHIIKGKKRNSVISAAFLLLFLSLYFLGLFSASFGGVGGNRCLLDRLRRLEWTHEFDRRSADSPLGVRCSLLYGTLNLQRNIFRFVLSSCFITLWLIDWLIDWFSDIENPEVTGK